MIVIKNSRTHLLFRKVNVFLGAMEHLCSLLGPVTPFLQRFNGAPYAVYPPVFLVASDSTIYYVGRLVGWSVASRFGSKAFIQRSADDRERLAKDEKEKQKALLQDSDLVAKRRKSSLREDEDKEEGDELKKDDKEEKEDKEEEEEKERKRIRKRRRRGRRRRRRR